MNCDQVRELLEAYALGALDLDERLKVEQHLANCPDCQRLATELANIAHTLPEALAVAGAADVRPPAPMKDKILQAIKKYPKGSNLHR